MSVDKNLIKEIIIKKQKEASIVKLTPRPLSFESGMRYVLVGVRRAGKSYLMLQDIQQRVADGEIAIEDCLIINFEDERLDGIQVSELNVIIECYQELYGMRKPYIYLDEIQNVAGWEKFCRRLADEKYRVMVTGSNAKMLSREIATTLGGRYIVKEIFPFSFVEYLRYHGIALSRNWQFDEETKLAVKRSFEDYFMMGGFAEMFPIVDKRDWLTGLYHKILLGDIVARHGIRNDRTIRLLARKVGESVMQPTSLSRFQHIVKSTGESISLPTLKDYLEYFEENYLVFSLLNFASPLTEQETIKKRYYMDNGLLNLFMYDGNTKLLENLCAIHLRRLYGNNEDPRVFFYSRNIEVDFYIPEESLAIQVSYDINDLDTKEREVGALVALNKVYPLKSAYIVTRDQEDTLTEGGLEIKVVPIWKWLLNEI